LFALPDKHSNISSESELSATTEFLMLLQLLSLDIFQWSVIFLSGLSVFERQMLKIHADEKVTHEGGRKNRCIEFSGKIGGAGEASDPLPI
jgi:hypothetical protein